MYAHYIVLINRLLLLYKNNSLSLLVIQIRKCNVIYSLLQKSNCNDNDVGNALLFNLDINLSLNLIFQYKYRQYLKLLILRYQ